MEEFLKNFANQFDETDPSEITPSTVYRDLEEWSSLIGLAILNMINKKYGVQITPSEIKGTNTIEEVYNLVQGKL